MFLKCEGACEQPVIIDGAQYIEVQRKTYLSVVTAVLRKRCELIFAVEKSMLDCYSFFGYPLIKWSFSSTIIR